MYGLTSDEINKIKEVFSRHKEIEKAILYGSRAQGNYQNSSDIDLSLFGEKITLTQLLEIENQLDDLLIPYKIDLSIYHKIENLDLIEHIDRVGKVFYENEKDEWQEYSLEEITHLIKEIYIPNTHENLDYIGLEHIEQETLRLNGVGSSLDVTSNKFKFNRGDILFGKLRPYFRKVVSPNFSGICSTDIWVLRSKSIATQDFLFYLIANWDFVNLSNGSEGGTRMPRADWNFLKQSRWSIPSRKEQTAIASILSSLDDKIDLLHRQNATLEKMAETLFRQWFVEEAKEEWEEGTISDLFILQRGFDLPIQMRIDGKFPIVASSGESGYHNVFKVKAPGVTTGRSGVLGNVFYIQEDFWPLNTSLFIKEYKNSSPIHSYFVLKSIDLNSFNAGSAVPTLNRNHVHEFIIKIPPLNIINEFDNIALPLFEKIKSNNYQMRTLTSMRDNLF